MLRFFRGGRVMAGLVTRSLQRSSVNPALGRIKWVPYVFFSCNDAGGDVKLGSSLNLQDNPHTPPSQSSPSNNGPEPFLSPPSHGCHFCAVNQLRTFCKPRNASEPACQNSQWHLENDEPTKAPL
ncbi:uncharacterized protein CLUP02_07641 [Colletotrichum lupini]|uniref:Uncharacterized protein n=1 Tax=Colletotrichum lupini TaxID=145971 RepID=A0A9Q8SRM2_9PEZI|nr:uncharacterized protein CLUP02_07641 [Colletotrichum lupini]UQC82155.1 hypothetical protein CLUP02_07641 [Colletotrichum lupini]